MQHDLDESSDCGSPRISMENLGKVVKLSETNDHDSCPFSRKSITSLNQVSKESSERSKFRFSFMEATEEVKTVNFVTPKGDELENSIHSPALAYQQKSKPFQIECIKVGRLKVAREG